ncbi:hypothetical protein LCGC14_1773430 [marine sediment metagenome]|uniref:Uncharacterized protein n=1 Tax=marine sediment metagenome TaxID=412755 RepID=A0A0F9HK30_9ZZZZ
MGRVFEEKNETIRALIDVLCDRCGKSCKCPLGNVEAALLGAHWGYSSGKDTEIHEAHLCEDCYDETVKTMGIKVSVREEGI